MMSNNVSNSPLFHSIGAVLKMVYGTDLHIQAREERDNATAAIDRMSEEAEKLHAEVALPKGRQLPIERVEDALEAIAEDL